MLFQEAREDLEDMNLREFDKLLGSKGSYVYCKDKKRINSLKYTVEEAEEWLATDNICKLGWWIAPDYIVLDFDDREAAKMVLQLLKENDIRTLIAKTTRGIHIYFRYNYTDTQRINAHLACGLRCDLKVSNKGYAALPYNFNNRKFNNATEIADLPVWLTPLDVSNSSPQYIPADKGNRNDNLFKQGSRLRNQRFEQKDIEEIIKISNRMCDDALTESELNTLILSSTKFELPHLDMDTFIFRNEKGEPTGLNHLAISNHIAENFHYFIYNKTVYWYKDGYYTSDDGELELQNAIKSLIPIPRLLKANTVVEIYKLCLMDMSKKYNLFENSHPNMMAFNNGTWDFTTGKLIEHSHKHLITVKIPYDCAGVEFKDSKLKELLVKMELPKGDVKMLIDFMSTLVVPRNYKTMLFLFGPTNTGKSILGKYMSKLTGGANTTSLSLEALTGRFYAAQLRNKLLNWYGDSSTQELKNISMLKMVTGGDNLIFEKKGKDADTTFINFSKLVYSFNALPPQREEKSSAFYERLRILNVHKSLPNLDHAFVDEVINSAPELILYLCQHATKLKEVSNSKRSRELIKELHHTSDNIMKWIDEKISITENPSDYVDYQRLKSNYLVWCAENDEFEQSEQKFTSTLTQLGLERTRISIKGERKRVVHGVKIKK